ncbi:flagellar basal body rod protein FlgB [Desulfuribacillus alkaliarsenatis]|uniref:Flagellar basal body rod protein FlgB n=1 Tax=Desulfuribacillus alkaliarsenatis TaxID=766136 RepID=A0A1E5G5Z7_9FIRM|nr:flagellar basal body rod protein FlgB [Desulfuribacillus alkaliarsenatis]OEF98601.1 flagellar basal-body rod protein FlgB [Desulfuribacillus alkaliarsenatis]
MDIFNNPSILSVHKALDAAQLRQHVIANNIANSTTPGFKKSSVKFEEYLSSALGRKGISGFRTDARHMPIGSSRFEDVAPRVITHKDSKINNNKNNVDIDAEMTDLAKTQIWYDALSTNMNGKFNKLRTAIGGR